MSAIKPQLSAYIIFRFGPPLTHHDRTSNSKNFLLTHMFSPYDYQHCSMEPQFCRPKKRLTYDGEWLRLKCSWKYPCGNLFLKVAVLVSGELSEQDFCFNIWNSVEMILTALNSMASPRSKDLN